MEKITRNTKWLLYSDDMDEMLGTEEERKQEYMACNDISPEEFEEDAFESWCDSWLYSFWEDFKEFTDKDQKVLFVADLGLWNGRRDGGKIGKLHDLIQQATEDYNTIYYYPKDGHMTLKAIHHDGTNYFKIYGLSEEGKRYVNNHEYDEERMVHNHLLRNKGKYLCPVVYTNI